MELTQQKIDLNGAKGLKTVFSAKLWFIGTIFAIKTIKTEFYKRSGLQIQKKLRTQGLNR
jgi:hypothetical protein